MTSFLQIWFNLVSCCEQSQQAEFILRDHTAISQFHFITAKHFQSVTVYATRMSHTESFFLCQWAEWINDETFYIFILFLGFCPPPPLTMLWKNWTDLMPLCHISNSFNLHKCLGWCNFQSIETLGIRNAMWDSLQVGQIFIVWQYNVA